MGKPYYDILIAKGTYRWKKCKTHLGVSDDVMSQNFHGKTGTAYLFDKWYNYFTGKVEDREMLTGLHRVCDVYCSGCQIDIGWKYVYAFEETEKYKVGKVIIEKFYFEEVK